MITLSVQEIMVTDMDARKSYFDEYEEVASDESSSEFSNVTISNISILALLWKFSYNFGPNKLFFSGRHSSLGCLKVSRTFWRVRTKLHMQPNLYLLILF